MYLIYLLFYYILHIINLSTYFAMKMIYISITILYFYFYLFTHKIRILLHVFYYALMLLSNEQLKLRRRLLSWSPLNVLLVGYRVGKYERVCNKCVVVRRRTLNELFTNVYTYRYRDKQYADFTIELSGRERIATTINGSVWIVHCNWIWNYYRHIIYFFACARVRRYPLQLSR